ncbi:MAG TPA: aminotransferase class V-fold PLP-dependent enzyme [Vicinamibacteria bacterium]|nr:aminotransferase class V-fold PLP-dependent enzyme [Vicinamibacteria bacterium]
MSIATSAAAETAERERERQRRCDAALAPLREAVGRLEGRSPEEAASDERLWHVVQAAFEVDRNIVNLNNGGVSPSPRLVQDALRRDLARGNEAPAYAMWSVLEPEVEIVRARLAALFGCDAEEVAITRNACESLETVLFGFDLKAGDEVLTTNQDYPRTLAALRQREKREGIVLRTISFPVPPSSLGDLLARFRAALTPRTRVLLVSHMTYLTGQIFPVAEICRMGREAGVEVVVDGAHALAQLPFRRDDLGCDYYGATLHKWVMAPHGTGFLYVRRSKIAGLWPLMAATSEIRADDIRKFEQIGTHPAAVHNAAREALAFHEVLGTERKSARLRYLRDRWARRLARHPRVRLLTDLSPEMSCGLGTFAVEGMAPSALAEALWDRARIFVVAFGHEEFTGVRVTPSFYTRIEDVDAFAEEVERILGS